LSNPDAVDSAITNSASRKFGFLIAPRPLLLYSIADSIELSALNLNILIRSIE